MNNRPHNILVSEEGKDGKNYYSVIGAAWPAKNRDGFDCKIKPNLSVSDSFIIRAPKEDNETQESTATPTE